MKKTLLILIIMISLCITGCSNTTYNLYINLNSKGETLRFNYENIDDMETLLEQNISSSSTLSDMKLNYSVVNSSVEINHIFDNINDLKKSEAIMMVYNDVNVDVTNDITKISMHGYNNSKFVCGEFDEGCELVLDKLTFNLTSEYQIVSSNADIIDKSNNKYTWILTAENRDEIYFSYNNEIRWDIVIKNFIRNNSKLITIVAISVVLLILLIVFVYKFFKKVKENNS